MRYAAESSRTTHGAKECIDACGLLSRILLRALAGSTKELILNQSGDHYPDSPKVAEIAQGQYRGKSPSHIRGSGYVVECLEAALWCFLNTDSFESAILTAANLGNDADTTAAVCGQVAGAFYGASAIPQHWLDRLVMRTEIVAIADHLREASNATD